MSIPQQLLNEWVPLKQAVLARPLVAALVPLFVALLLKSYFGKKKRDINARNLPLPPGPKRYPLVGNLLQMPQVYPWIVYDKWGKEYGDLTYLEVMGQRIIICNNVASISHIFEKRAVNTSERLWMPIFDLLKLDWAFPFMNYTPFWKLHRRDFHQHLGPMQIHVYRPIIKNQLFKHLREMIANPDDFRNQTRSFLGLTIMRIGYGINDAKYNENLIVKAQAVNQGFSEASIAGRYLVNYLPILKLVPAWFPGAAWRRHLDSVGRISQEVSRVPFKEAKERVQNGVSDEHPSVVRGLIDALPAESDPSYEERAIVARNVAAIGYIAGSDTSLSGVYGMILALGMHPEVLRKAQKELDSVVGPDRLPVPDDFEHCHYVQAIIKESARWHTVGPLSLPHISKNEDEYNGYFLPAGTVFLPNTWAVMHDPVRFPDPMAFKPERYLTKEGKFNKEVLDPDFGVFGYGRRMCPGRFLSTDIHAYYTMLMIYIFNIGPRKDANGKEIPLKYEIGSETICTPAPFLVDIRPRSPKHAALVTSSA
ncbi:cytochrome P450 98A3 [Coprinopsis marcescibilis]|uniref:Cytochrome P450 98A3 n=1 Tax=Coprinopsis marcescibilis TaxID=230819 RepID=A0A5C3KIX6_COPMA|nr:cytochrome P450 98A3 [Coprinopsis marcescibilis]